jgi:aspartate dehydrogenase
LERGIDLDRLTQETVIFEGSAREACRCFPRHVNVPAALSLAGVGLEKTWVRVVAAPGCRFNQHQIEARGEFGRLFVDIENVPSSTNPHTGLLSIYSSIATLAEYAQSRGGCA